MNFEIFSGPKKRQTFEKWKNENLLINYKLVDITILIMITILLQKMFSFLIFYYYKSCSLFLHFSTEDVHFLYYKKGKKYYNRWRKNMSHLNEFVIKKKSNVYFFKYKKKEKV